MAKVVILGAGIAGHTAALYLRKKLGTEHKVTVVSPNSKYQWIPSNIWVGIGQMTEKHVAFPLAPVYKKQGIEYIQAKAISIHPEGNQTTPTAFITVQKTGKEESMAPEIVEYDYLVNATGPKLNFDATPGLGPAGFTQSVCTYQHAEEAWEGLQKSLKKMEQGEKQIFLIGTGHPTATCQGAAFEYALNVAFEINKRKLNHLAEIVWITNEYELGDFGMGGAFIKKGGYITSTRTFTESILSEYGIRWIKRAGIVKVEEKQVTYITLDGKTQNQSFDFAMLIPAFAGAGIKAFDKTDADITSVLFAPSGFMKVDANYDAKDFENWAASDWPSRYQNTTYDNIYAPGIAFAPPHPISKPMKTPDGVAIFPSPPRTGMPSGVMGKVVALNIVDRIKHGITTGKHQASMAKMGAACIISSGYGLKDGMAATMTVFPVVPDFEKYPKWGRDHNYTMGEPGLAGHWIKLLLHVMFIYKAKAKPFWYLIPE
ncbi:MAG: FAD-dependent oxidoreductase [Sphingobacteriia bacterium]|nr:FAD-dependent oxidoreductase [Sphingobacteriia bacterium]